MSDDKLFPRAGATRPQDGHRRSAAARLLPPGRGMRDHLQVRLRHTPHTFADARLHQPPETFRRTTCLILRPSWGPATLVQGNGTASMCGMPVRARLRMPMGSFFSAQGWRSCRLECPVLERRVSALDGCWENRSGDARRNRRGGRFQPGRPESLPRGGQKPCLRAPEATYEYVLIAMVIRPSGQRSHNVQLHFCLPSRWPPHRRRHFRHSGLGGRPPRRGPRRRGPAPRQGLFCSVPAAKARVECGMASCSPRQGRGSDLQKSRTCFFVAVARRPCGAIGVPRKPVHLFFPSAVPGPETSASPRDQRRDNALSLSSKLRRV